MLNYVKIYNRKARVLRYCYFTAKTVCRK